MYIFMFQTRSGDAKKFEIKRMLRNGREKKEFKKSFLEAGTGILLIATILANPLCSSPNREKVKKDEIVRMAEKNYDDRDVRVRKLDSVCVVGCKVGNGPFHWKKEAYEVDVSEGSNYHKEFYDVYGIPIMEGIGDDTERFFLNPNWEGNAKVVQVIKVGDGKWMSLSEFEGDNAKKTWEKVQEIYKSK